MLLLTQTVLFRSSHQRCSKKKGVLKNFVKFTGKHLCQSLFFNKVEELRPATLWKKRLWRRCFPVDFAKFLRTPFFYLQWLLLKFISHHTKEMLYVRGSLHALFHPGLKFPRSEISPWGEIFFVYMDLSPRGEIYTFSPRDETFIVFTLGWI